MIPYRGAGLDSVYLSNGYTVRVLPSGEEAISIHNLEGLHKAIAIELAGRQGQMDGQTFRFLRKFTDMGQRAIGDVLGVSELSVSNWERAKHDVPGAAAEWLRGFIRELTTGNAALKDAVDRYNHIDREVRQIETRIAFEETNGDWQRQAA
jgi:putative transcriptional regulator